MLGNKAIFVLETLEKAGYKAFAVGGCVRDILLGKEPSDIDVATSALPSQTELVFKDYRVIETGMKHGTITVIVDGEAFEITTFRLDGEYGDARHPEKVEFTSDVEQDLARRDFTVNSMAMDARGNVIDVFGGREDLENKVLRCTGEPEKRFEEDALRIMRAVRFSSQLGFEIEEKTAESIHANKSRLSRISVERKFTELKKLLVGKDVFRVLTEYSDVICEVIPELAPAVGFDHKSRYHIYDVYTHIAKSVAEAPPDERIRLTMLLHDVAKPYVCTFDGTNRHFHGHPELGEKMAREILTRLHADNETIRLVSLMCLIHDRQIEVNEKAVRRLLSKISFNDLLVLCEVRKADAASHLETMTERGYEADEIKKIAEKIIEEGKCFSMRDLAVDGNDIKALGASGREIGRVLESLLDGVIDGTLQNEKAALINKAAEITAEK